MNRDDELDSLVEDLKDSPYIERPDTQDVRNGALCWNDRDRVCGPDCMAFNAEEGLDENGLVLDTPNKCLILKYAGQIGSGALAVIRLAKKMDDPRTPPPPPNPFGGRS